MVSTKLICIPIGQTVLYLTPEEYRRALRRGKAIKRAQRIQKRSGNLALKREEKVSRTLGWKDERRRL